MKINSTQLRHLIREILYRASAPKRYGLPDIEVDANDTAEAGQKASAEFARAHGMKGIDPFSIDVQEIVPEEPKGDADNARPEFDFELLTDRIVDYMGSMSPKPNWVKTLRDEISRQLDQNGRRHNLNDDEIDNIVDQILGGSMDELVWEIMGEKLAEELDMALRA